jgi:uncharacterized membrane protein YkoI
MRSFSVLLLSPLAAIFLGSAAQADRLPDAQERAAIEQVLLDAGYTRWDEIELDDNGSVWDVDDAIGPDGREYDVDLDADTLEIVSERPD